jgi:hypothetical protein
MVMAHEKQQIVEQQRVVMVRVAVMPHEGHFRSSSISREGIESANAVTWRRSGQSANAIRFAVQQARIFARFVERN